MRNRKWHRKLALIVFLPFVIILLTGILLQIKRWIPVLEPTSELSATGGLSKVDNPLGLNDLLNIAKGVPQAQILSWNDIRVIQIKPNSGMAKVESRTNYEIQIDLSSGKVLSSGKSYEDLLIGIHEGSFFGGAVRNFIFLPVALLLVFLTLTGVRLLIKKRSSERK